MQSITYVLMKTRVTVLHVVESLNHGASFVVPVPLDFDRSLRGLPDLTRVPAAACPPVFFSSQRARLTMGIEREPCSVTKR